MCSFLVTATTELRDVTRYPKVCPKVYSKVPCCAARCTCWACVVNLQGLGATWGLGWSLRLFSSTSPAVRREPAVRRVGDASLPAFCARAPRPPKHHHHRHHHPTPLQLLDPGFIVFLLLSCSQAFLLNLCIFRLVRPWCGAARGRPGCHTLCACRLRASSGADQERSSAEQSISTPTTAPTACSPACHQPGVFCTPLTSLQVHTDQFPTGHQRDWPDEGHPHHCAGDGHLWRWACARKTLLQSCTGLGAAQLLWHACPLSARHPQQWVAITKAERASRER